MNNSSSTDKVLSLNCAGQLPVTRDESTDADPAIDKSIDDLDNEAIPHNSNKTPESNKGKLIRKDTGPRLRYEPDSWSILRHTIPNLFQLDTEARDSILNTSDECTLSIYNLPDEEWEKFASAGIYRDDTFYVILAASIECIINLRITPRTFEVMMNAFKVLCERLGVPIDYCDIVARGDAIISENEIIGLNKFRIDSFEMPLELADELRRGGLILWEDLLNKSERSILKSAASYFEGFKLIKAVWNIKCYIHFASATLTKSDAYQSFSDMANQFISQVIDDPTNRTIMIKRLGVLGNGKNTLQDLGELFGLTRERIRQREAKALKSLLHRTILMRLSRFRLGIAETLRISGGICLLSELATSLVIKFEWKEQPEEESFASFVYPFGGFEVNREFGLIYDQVHECYNCSRIVADLEEVFAEDRSEKSLADIMECLRLSCVRRKECTSCSSLCEFSEGFINFVADKTENILVKDRIVFHRYTWGAKIGTRVQLVERILKNAGRPMHFSEVYNEVKTLTPEDDLFTERNVHSWLGNSGNILLWDRGTFVYCDFLKVPSGFIKDTESWLLDKLNSGIPFISIGGVYNLLKDECARLNILSESALYTCLRRWGSCSDLHYPTYPQVYLKEGFDSRIPAFIAVEQFIRDANGKIEYDVLKKYAQQDLCLKSFQFQGCLPKLANVVRTKSGGFIHVESLQVDTKSLAQIKDYIMQVLQKYEHISIAKIYNDKIVTCTMAGIDSPEMLFSLLKLVFMNEFNLSNYPRISIAKPSESSSKYLATEITDYIKRKAAPCSFDELEVRFVEKLGYSEGSTYNAAVNRDGIVRFGRGTLIHLDTLEWTDDKQRNLELQASIALDRARNAGRHYARVSDLLEYHEIPVLANRMAYTQTLLCELLIRCKRIRILGTARNAFVNFPNNDGINTFEDLVREKLVKDYGGASDLKSFEEDLQKAGIVRKSVTAEMLGTQEKVSIKDNVIMLAELCGHA